MSEPGKIDLLIVDDDVDFRSTIVRRFLRRGYEVHEASDAEEALGMIQRRQFDVAVLDMVMPGMSGLELMEKFNEIGAECETIMLTGQGTIESAVEAMKLGAFDYLTKPFPLSELEVVITKANERRRLCKENSQLKTVISRGAKPPDIIGESSAMQEVFRLIKRAGPTDKAILIQGESGTGKELVARALHKANARAEMPLVVINCAALPETLLESELFGHEKGAFTGAIGTKQGLFEVADHGTLMIDEIGEMSGAIQAKLLRVLEDGSMRRIGSIKERGVDVRLVAARNRDLAEDVRAGRFREDLYYRINVLSLELPPLRERDGDIRLLVERFLGPDWKIDAETMRRLEGYDWPGNVRQLMNALDRAKIMADDGQIHWQDLPAAVVGGRAISAVPRTVADGDALAEVERAHIVDVLNREGGNKARTARMLGINRRSLYRLLDKYSIRWQPEGATVGHETVSGV